MIKRSFSCYNMQMFQRIVQTSSFFNIRRICRTYNAMTVRVATTSTSVKKWCKQRHECFHELGMLSHIISKSLSLNCWMVGVSYHRLISWNASRKKYGIFFGIVHYKLSNMLNRRERKSVGWKMFRITMNSW